MIKKKSLAEEVAFNIRKDILTGKYLLDEKLPIEPELMKKFGVGRSTIREAIKLLSNAGFLRVQQGVGTFISSVNINEEPIDQRLKRADVQELNEVRQLLEMKIAEKAAINRSENKRPETCSGLELSYPFLFTTTTSSIVRVEALTSNV